MDYLPYLPYHSIPSSKKNARTSTMPHHLQSALPQVSVLMPVRNEDRYLQAALDSLYRQTCINWELIAIDDGSSDHTAAILAEAARGDRRVQVIRREGGGLVAALNSGLNACRAPLVARMDGDDICHPRRLELQSSYLDSHPDTGLAASNFRHFPRTGLKQGMIDYETWQNSLSEHSQIIRDLFVESPFVHPSVMMRRTVLEELGGYQDNSWPEDYDLWLRMAAAGIRFARIPHTLLLWRDHPERATRTMDEYASHAFRSCKCHHLLRGFLQSAHDVVIAGAGLEARAWQRLLTTAHVTVSTWLDVDPRKIGRILHNAPVIPPEALHLNGRKMIVAIGVRGARKQFREVANRRGWQEGIDFVCVA
jgi:glycosyltransferase involved in cell wall biosynthesis